MRVLMTLDLGSKGRTELEISMLDPMLATPGDAANDQPGDPGRARRRRPGRSRIDSRAVLRQILEDVNAFQADRALNAQKARARFHVVGSTGGPAVER